MAIPFRILFLGCLLPGWAATAVADAVPSEQPEEETLSAPARSLDEIARDLANPATTLTTLRNDFEFRSYQGNLPGAGDQDSWRYVLTPTLPIRLNGNRQLRLRATIPINTDQPLYLSEGEQYSEWKIRRWADVLPRDGEFITGHDHLDDVGVDIAYGGTSDNGLIGMFGLKAVFPSSQDLSSSRDEWLLGPEVVVGKEASWGVVGVTASHLVDVSGESEYRTKLSELDVFFAWGLGNGWQVISNPKIEYDWEAAGDNRLLLPIGGGISKTFRIGRTPLKLDAELYNYLESPEALGPDWQFSFTVTPAFGGF
jgi:hypothetical protein